ncbi:MAG: tRNA uridine(34) 5-carboxymethylaminomethyl modification radical SAM/GNAT enzyme Elp3 [Candidatus Magasanikbacteria bacterium]|nr:tRNA uridine(34) 5-carboxymethylaminomethyl modification radical SAM/GNAT enzyme Elp3 [Candidatus Magasanikbacteria bacterium]
MEKFEQIIQHILSQNPQTKRDFDDARRKICSKLHIPQPSNSKMLVAYQNLVKKQQIKKSEFFESLFRKADIRSLSGVAVITSLIKPYTCPGKCIYCPTEVRMPKSYIATEPAAARALALNFSPNLQMTRRIDMLEKNGHPVDKIEYILKGGTWNAYPIKYQYWFILESFKACNNLTRRKKVPELISYSDLTLEELQQIMDDEQEYNDKKATHKIIGLTLETRPDAISPKSIYHMRRQGCTRIELGLQAPDDKILDLVVRGHSVQQFKDAIFLLRQAGFKVDLHFMPDLPGTTAKHDVEMYASLFTDPGFMPDMVKIYPCTVIKTAELSKWYDDGRYTPYDSKALFEALLQMKKLTPRYCRISRLIRDIPTNEIQAGNSITNLREALQVEMKKRGWICQCLRCREVGHSQIAITQLSKLAPILFVDEYETTGGTEYFLSFEDPDRKVVFGFLRLRLPKYEGDVQKMQALEKILELGNLDKLAFVRELHTYGQLVGVGQKNASASQHKGLGKKLVAEAEKIAKKNGYEKIAAISGVGVKGYYRKFGYRKMGMYVGKKLK